MYFIKNGKKVKYNSQPIPQRPNENGDGEKCPSWVFGVLGLIAALIAVWIVLSIIKDKKQ